MNRLIPAGYHDQSLGLYVINDLPKAEKVLGELSDVNKEALTKRANEDRAKAHEWGKHAEEQGYLSKLIGKYGSHGVSSDWFLYRYCCQPNVWLRRCE